MQIRNYNPPPLCSVCTSTPLRNTYVASPWHDCPSVAIRWTYIMLIARLRLSSLFQSVMHITRKFCVLERKVLTYRQPWLQEASKVVILLGVFAISYNIFTHFLIKGIIYKKKKKNWKQNVCFNFPYNFDLKHEFREMLSQLHMDLQIKYPLFMSDFNEIWIFSTDFRKIFQHQISFKKILPVGAELFHAGGRTTQRYEEAII